MTRVLITGASGFLGHNLASLMSARHEVFAAFGTNAPDPGPFAAVQFDISNADEVLGQVERVRPELVVHCAAISRPDECERLPERAIDIIVSGTRNIAEACSRICARLVHISTDLVFDGERGHYTEEDPVHGISVYARTKIQAERVVQSISESSVVLRVALLFGKGSASHPGSIAAIVRRWREGRALTFYTDQYRTPIFAPQVCDAVSRLAARTDIRGVFHLGGADRVSRFEFAVILAMRAGVPLELVRPGSMLDSQALAPRGADCSLISNKIRDALGIRLLTCAEALDLMQHEGLLRKL